MVLKKNLIIICLAASALGDEVRGGREDADGPADEHHVAEGHQE